MNRGGTVLYNEIPCGKIRETDEGYSFEYDSEWLINPNAQAISLTLPLGKQAYKSKTLFPFFDGLIPEGWLLSVVTRNWKLDPEDRFGLLLVSCEDSIGDVSVKNAGRESFDEDRESRIVTEIAGNQKNKEVPRK
jgi:serine/threonine-protein kinase HipA